MVHLQQTNRLCAIQYADSVQHRTARSDHKKRGGEMRLTPFDGVVRAS